MFKYESELKQISPTEVMQVNIRFNDECKNGHYDWAITADIYGKQYRKHEPEITYNKKRYWLESCGCQHNEILRHWPEFKIFVDLHLSDFRGVPRYPIANGRYHMEEKSTAINYLRLVGNEYSELHKTKSEGQFAMTLINLKAKDWLGESVKAQKYLAELLGLEYSEITTAVNNYIDTLVASSQEERALLGHWGYSALGYITSVALMDIYPNYADRIMSLVR